MNSELTYHFVVNCSFSQLQQYECLDPDSEDAAKIFTRGDLEWCLQTYLILKRRKNLNVSCSNTFLDGAINIIHSEQLYYLRGAPNHFIVSVQADYPKRRWAHFHIVQNKSQETVNATMIPLWIQPALMCRDLSRNNVSTVAYAGQTINGNLAGSVEMWKALIKPLGLKFVHLPSGRCYNLREVDVLVAIRSFDNRSYNNKPPSKLINAWHAGIPFIGGADSAYRQVGTPNEDYLVAKTPKELFSALQKLLHNNDLYNILVDNGRKKAASYTKDAIANIWEKALTGPVKQRYLRWKENGNNERYRFSLMLKASILEYRSIRLIKRIINRKK